jgi:DNA repair protein RecO
MRAKNTKIIILGTRNLKEADKLIFAYSEDFGKLKIIAKGARRHKSKFLGHTQTLNIAETSLYFGPNSVLLTEIKTINASKTIRSRMKSMISALQIAEITEQCILENQEIPGLFKLLETTIEELQNNKKTELILTSYTIKLLNLLGMLPDFKEIRTRLPEKYRRFFEYVKVENFDKLMKIALNQQDENIIKDITKKLLEYQNQKESKALNFKLALI